MESDHSIFSELKTLVLKDVQSKEQSPDFGKLCVRVIDFYESQYPIIRSQLAKVIQKYTIEYLSRKGVDNDYVHVFLSLEETCKDTFVSIDEGGDIYDLDLDIGKISEAPGADFYDQLGFFDYLSGEFDFFGTFHTTIILTLLVKTWIDMKGYEQGVVMKSNENASVQQFFFNDCEWNEKSVFFNTSKS